MLSRNNTHPGPRELAEESAAAIRYIHPTSAAADQIVLLDDNVLWISASNVHFAPFPVGPAIGAYLRSLGMTSLVIAEQNQGSARKAVDLLDCIVRDDLFGLNLELRRVSLRLGERPQVFSVNKKCAPSEGEIVFSGHQPGYFRSLGFFAKMASSDIFCFADDLQYMRREWQNRQRFPRPGGVGVMWLTVPLLSGSGFESIRSKRIANGEPGHNWRFKHWKTIESAYARARYFDRYAPFLHNVYQRDWQTLGALCEAITRFCALELGIKTPILINSSQVNLPVGLRKGERIAAEIEALRRQLPDGRAVYLKGAGASYLDTKRPSGVSERDFLERQGIEIRSCIVDTSIITRETGLDPYSPAVAFLFHLGPDACRLMTEATRCQ
jgi:hypothetical protein